MAKATAKKKVLFTSHTANFQKFNRPFMRMLAEKGYEVHYASMGEEEILDADKSFIVPFTRSPFKLRNIKAYKQLKKIIDREDYDLIHTHTPMGSVVTRLAARDARKKGTRVIYTAHGFHFFKGAPLLNWVIYYPVEKWMARHTDILVTINKEDYDIAGARFNTQVECIPGVGVDFSRFRAAHEGEISKLRKKNHLSPVDYLLVCVAELNSNKNQAFLINAMPYILKVKPGAKLILCGSGPSEAKYRSLIERRGLEESVVMLGYRDDIDEVLRMSNIAVSASKREGLGLGLVEAMASGLPVVASNNRGHREIARYLQDGVRLFDVYDADSYIEAVVDALSAPSLADKRLLGAFSLDRAVDSFVRVYQVGVNKEGSA